ncbi:MAG TPA: endolytic transglycosylase MltG, partial [Rhizomicrobium sp.]|nr:endolytic transglycosylase MltG [Rhizomicrobium sp.]
MRRLTVLVVVLGILGAIAYAWVMASWTQAGPAARAGGETVVMIPSGTRAHDTAGMLEAAGVVNNALLFEAGLRLRGLAAAIKAGEYAFPSGASMADVAGVLVAGRSIQHRLTVAEGLTSDMVWKLVA